MRADISGAPSSISELPRSFLRDWVAAVRGVGIPGNLEPGQAEACPHTAAITLNCGRKKRRQQSEWGRLCAKFSDGFLHPAMDFAMTWGEPYRRPRLLARILIDRSSQNMSIAVMGGNSPNRAAVSAAPSGGQHVRTHPACRSASGPGADRCCWLPSCGPPASGRRAHTLLRGTP